MYVKNRTSEKKEEIKRARKRGVPLKCILTHDVYNISPGFALIAVSMQSMQRFLEKGLFWDCNFLFLL